MALRDRIPELLAKAEKEEDPEVLARIAARLQDALEDKIKYLRRSDRTLEPYRRGENDSSKSRAASVARRSGD